MDKVSRFLVKLPNELTTSLETGASISNDGCCLTVSDFKDNMVYFDVMEETLWRTTMGSKKVGDQMNIERAAHIGDEIGGHLMSGHISCRGYIVDIVATENSRQITIELPVEFSRYVLYKGYIGIDGISLTVGKMEKNKFNLHLIPETLQRTTISSKKRGDEVNIEIDPQTQAIVNTVERLLNTNKH